MTIGRTIELLKEAGFTPREIIEAVKDGTFINMAALVADQQKEEKECDTQTG